MNLLSRLKSIFNIKIDLSKFKEIHIFSDNTGPKYEYHNHKKITINVSEKVLGKKESSQLKQLLKSAEAGTLLLEENSKKLLDDFSAVDQEKENRELLKYLKDKIPVGDLQVLRAALYIKNVFERGEKVGELKLQIMQRYGSRGKNISNLCTAGYFTSLIKPLYEEMSKYPDFALGKFQEAYDVIVTEQPFAVFVSQQMSERELRTEVERKMVINKKYGIRYLNIHGIGEDNVSKILRLLRSMEDKFIQPADIDSEKGFITVKIWF